MRRFGSLFFVFVLMLSGVAQAETAINAAGATDLKKQIDDSLQWRLDMAKLFGQGLTMDGNIDVVPKGSYYEVTVPHLGLLAGPKGKLDIGTVVINAAPGEKAGSWQIQQATVPSSMTYTDGTSEPVAVITVGKQHFSGVWWPERQMYPKLDALYQDITIKGTSGEPINATIGEIKSVSDLKDNPDNTWSGDMNFEASAVRLELSGKNPTVLNIGKVISHNAYDHLDIRRAMETKKEARAFLSDGKPKTDQQQRDFIKKLMSQQPVLANGMSGALEVDKFDLHDTGDDRHPARSFGFDKLAFSGAASDEQQAKSNALMKASFSGLRASVVPPALADLFPHTMNAEVSFNNLPMRKMMETFYGIVQNTLAGNQTGPEAQKQLKGEMNTALGTMPKMLADNGASVTVRDTYLKSIAAEEMLAGKIEANDKAATGATGKMVLSIKGLDEAVKKMQTSSLKIGADPNALGYLGGLTMLQAKGKPDKAADGKSLRNYVFQLTEDGKILMNGEDISATPPSAPEDAKEHSVPPHATQSTPSPAEKAAPPAP